MGAYLTQPKTDKESSDESNDLLVVGASSMQGWRNSQEDAHNSILNFDADTSFFAVYDGHGGAEVAAYCANILPNFLKQLPTYKSGEFETALKEAFLGFDQTLLEPKIVEILKVLAGEKNFNDGEPDELEEDDEEDLEELHEESNLPLQEVLKKYSDNPLMPQLKKLKEIDNCAAGSKPQSPYLRGRRAAAVAADAVNKAVMDPDAHPQGSSTSKAAAAAAAEGPSSSRAPQLKMDTDEPEEDSTVSSSSSSASKNNNINSNNNNNAEAAATAAADGKVTANGATISPDSSLVKECEQNGSVTSSEAKANKELVVSTSGAAADNAIVSASSDSTDCKQNGSIVGSSSSISSTSKESKIAKQAKAAEEDDSTDEDADYNANEDLQNEQEEEDDEEDDDDDDGEADADAEDEEEYDMDEEAEEGEEFIDEEEDDDEEDDENEMVAENFCPNSMMEEPGKDSGCTAVVALLHGRDLYVANAGDSRCVVCRNGKAIDMSLDHKPEDEEESKRIVKAGGRVTMDGRVNGGLNLSRAIGDHAYKMNNHLKPEEQMISALPDIKKLIISPEDEFMILACDGIWNFMSSEEVVDFVRKRLLEQKKMSQICEDLFDNCLAPNTMGDGTGCDNMTAVIVRFQSKLQELSTKINPEETEDVLAFKRINEEEAASAAAAAAALLQRAVKRVASPTSDSSEAENALQNKRLKTDDNEFNAGKVLFASTTTATADADADTDASQTSTTAAVQQNECDSVNASHASAAAATSAPNEALATATAANAAAAVSST